MVLILRMTHHVPGQLLPPLVRIRPLQDTARIMILGKRKGALACRTHVSFVTSPSAAWASSSVTSRVTEINSLSAAPSAAACLSTSAAEIDTWSYTRAIRSTTVESVILPSLAVITSKSTWKRTPLTNPTSALCAGEASFPPVLSMATCKYMKGAKTVALRAFLEPMNGNWKKHANAAVVRRVLTSQKTSRDILQSATQNALLLRMVAWVPPSSVSTAMSPSATRAHCWLTSTRPTVETRRATPVLSALSTFCLLRICMLIWIFTSSRNLVTTATALLC